MLNIIYYTVLLFSEPYDRLILSNSWATYN